MRPRSTRLCLTRLCLAALATVSAAASAQQHNVLLVIADDMGVDLVNAYGVPQSIPSHTPVIDTLANGGLLFRNVWANPVCSPTRAQILTGRHAYRTGVGNAINYDVEDWEVQLSETSIAKVLEPFYRTAVIGKWHLSAADGTGPLHPLLMGFEHHKGTLSVIPNFIGDDYFHYEKSVDGTTQMSFVYATTDTVNDCLAQIQSFSEPWFIWLAFNAPHAPFHKPPASLHTYTLPPTLKNADIPIHARAMAEAMDTELGRLLASMNPAVLANTVIIFVGDNGTDKFAVLPPLDEAKAKGTLYEGGVRVPLIIRGPGVAAGAECAGLVCATDLFATIADIAGQPHPTGTDSVSLVPYFTNPGQSSLRPYAYAEFFEPNGIVGKGEWLRAVRDKRYKVISTLDTALQPTPVLALYDLQLDPLETVNLLAGPLTPPQQQAFNALKGQLAVNYQPWLADSAGVPGAFGEPKLAGGGSLTPGSVVSLTLTNARPSAPALLMIGSTWLHESFKGGIIGPDPDAVVPLVTSPSGGAVMLGHWPAGLPAGTSIYYQFWIADPAGPKGLSASNNVSSQTPY